VKDRRAFLLAGLCAAPGLGLAQAPLRRVACFHCGGTRLGPALGAMGWRLGQDLRIEPRSLGDSPAQGAIDAAAREVVATAPDVVVTFMREQVGAVVRATRTIPVVAALHDPVADGFARTLARPGGNVTGIAFSSPESVKMTFRILGQALPALRRLHTLEPPGWSELATVKGVRSEIAAKRGLAFEPHPVADLAQATRVLESIRNPREEALVFAVAMRGFDYAAFAPKVLRSRVAMVDMSGQLEEASLLGAGMRHPDMWGRLAAIVDQVLRGTNPAGIPFELPTHAVVTLNRRVAATIGVTFPPEVLLRATRLID